LSAFNGLESLVADLYTSVDPDIRVMPIKGKTFDMDSARLDELAKWGDIEKYAPVLEEIVFIQYQNQQSIVTIRGIDESYLPFLNLDSFVYEGELAFNFRGVNAAFMGFGIADNLNLYVGDGNETMQVFAAKRDGINSMNPENKFVSKRILPSGIVALNPEFDYSYFYTSFDFAADLLQYTGEASYLDITLSDDQKTKEVKEKLIQHFGDRFEVKSRIELNDIIFKTNATEKWVTFFILSFIMVVATFNLIGSLSMLIIDKKNDISLFRSLGFTVKQVQSLFVTEGLMIAGVGSGMGLLIGVTIVSLQEYIGFFPLEGGIVKYYPVRLELLDLASVMAVSFVIGFAASWLPSAVLLRSSKLQTMVAS